MDDSTACIARALDVIESRLQEEVSVGEMAAAAGYSLYHFIRLFNQYVHHTPYDYLVRRRLAEAARRMLAGKRRLMDIAADYCFQSAESFTRAFTRVYRVPPSRVRKENDLDERLVLAPRGTGYIDFFRTYGRPQAQERVFPQCCLTGFFQDADLVLTRPKEALSHLQSYASRPLAEWYCIGSPPQSSGGSRLLFTGFEIADFDELPQGLYARRLPAGSWVVFQTRAPLAGLDYLRSFIYQTWQANHNQTLDARCEICRLGTGSLSGYLEFEIILIATIQPNL